MPWYKVKAKSSGTETDWLGRVWPNQNETKSGRKEQSRERMKEKRKADRGRQQPKKLGSFPSTRQNVKYQCAKMNHGCKCVLIRCFGLLERHCELLMTTWRNHAQLLHHHYQIWVQIFTLTLCAFCNLCRACDTHGCLTQGSLRRICLHDDAVQSLRLR